MSLAEPVRSSNGVPSLNALTLQVVHDNHPYAEALKTAWGFSAFVTGPAKTILFDTGSDGTLLLENMAKLQLDPARIELVVLSHVHGDHTGGLTGLLQANPRVQVFLPASLPARFKDVVRGYGATVVEIDGPREIDANVYTTGSLGRRIQEQALILRTRAGLVVLTGCAHPGIGGIVTKVRQLHAEDILLVAGGFHLEWATRRRVRAILGVFRSHQVRFVAPTHCSGEKTQEWFRQEYGPDYIDAGVGKTIRLADLTA
ncbi:MAG: MBL fold metallo-hydrolase [Planctomycetes bacterium]|jgi:7,8-dihydropterin-6-yl-methyl-4-(beta-D-ribofuranosyl)aminobenzene 5'-phosphate synthase|nr:MBL fold metallo-hydrolase [Planctomycetota bacterium]